ncbi:MAG: Lrp/AsnC ligand binding domain-containing protein [Bacteroidaceae bacterium]|nr:AsnC family transcriptional regulator [Bacteroidales bacterium]MBQ2878178.1 Lrp/AsnC ligand binding domain-containing protein [Bacteroidaceae bacterium]MBQ3187878.1 Lrp/AsnC ligand binding domain-containing protein [Bacteroidaceae bacterium]MBQ3622609.1 Lrp/AsnC ligand binding domain-containing protein [Bacteroidaceae bacterium]
MKNNVECKVDSLDLKILSIISKDARIPFRNVAELCGVSRAAIHLRVQHLMDMGIISGSCYEIDFKRLGYKTCTYIGIRLEKGSMYKDVVEHLRNIPEVVESSYTTGPYSILVKMFAHDNEQLMELLNDKIQSIPGVVGTETMIVLDGSIKRNLPME